MIFELCTAVCKIVKEFKELYETSYTTVFEVNELIHVTEKSLAALSLSLSSKEIINKWFKKA